MTVEELLCQDFADDTAYERLVLVTVVDPDKPPPGVVFATNDIRGNGSPSLGPDETKDETTRPGWLADTPLPPVAQELPTSIRAWFEPIAHG
jgi:hypothetical protein